MFLIPISIQNQFLIQITKSISKLKCISNPDLNHKSVQKLKWISNLDLGSESISNLDQKINSKYKLESKSQFKSISDLNFNFKK